MNNQINAYITLAADDVFKLRMIDVYRVLESAAGDNKLLAVAKFISSARPDLIDEINACVAELRA